MWFLGHLKTLKHLCFFSEFSSKKLFVIQFFISTMHSISFSIWCVWRGGRGSAKSAAGERDSGDSGE